MTGKSKAIVAVLCVAVAGLAVYQGYQALKPVPAPVEKETLVEAVIPTTGSISVTSQFIGRVAPDQMVQVYPKTQGTVLHTYVQPGDQVQAGDLLMEIDPTDIQLQVDIAAAGYDLAAASAAQTTGSTVELQKIQAQSSYDAAARSYRDARDALDEFEDGYDDSLEGLERIVSQTSAALQSAQDTLQASKEKLAQLEQDLADLENGTAGGGDSTGQGDIQQAADDAADLVDQAQDALDAIDPTADPEGYAAAQETLLQAQTAADGLQVLADEGSGGDPSDDDTADKIAELEKEIELQQQRVELNEQFVASASSAYQQAVNALEQAEAGYDVNYDQLKSAVRQASSARDTAEDSLNVIEEMMIPEVDEIAQAQMAQAEASLRSAVQQLSYTKVYAPIDGVVESANVEENNMYTSTMPAFVVSNKGMLTVTFNVPANIASSLLPGDSLTIENGSAVYDGTVLEVSTQVNSQSGLFPIKAQIHSSDPTLLTGLAVKVTVDAQRADDALLIPVDAVYYEGEESYVYLLKEGKSVRTPVTTGLSSGDQIQILDGISPEDAVITTWSTSLEDGAEVTLTGALPSQQRAAQESAASSSAGEEGSSSSAEEASSSTSAGEEASSSGDSGTVNPADE